jgi:molybdopterin molybdotransferase
VAEAEATLVALADVQRLALSGARRLPPVRVGIDEALDCVTAEDVLAAEDVPPFANTAMDGYAVRSADTLGAPVELVVVGVLAAGAAPTVAVGPGQAIKIMTGAPIPDGADAIAIVERTEAAEPSGTTGRRHVRILDEVPVGAHFRAAGSDIAAGSVAVTAGTALSPSHIGVLASVGAGTVLVHGKPRVGVLSTGDELAELRPDGTAPPLRPGQIRDSNRHALLATLRRDGFQPVDIGIVRDTQSAVSEALGRALLECDAVLTTGGVSMGEFDYVKVVLASQAASAEAVAAGAAVYELGVAIRPAKPLVVAFLPSGKAEGGLVPVFGLPGNPVSCLVSYLAIALPALRVLAGRPAAPPPVVSGIAGEDFHRRSDGKTHLIRVVASFMPDGRLEARPSGGQMSHQLRAMADANALAVVPNGSGIDAGARVDLIVFGPVA